MDTSAQRIAITLPVDDWRKIVQALRNEAFQLSQQSQVACSKSALEYGTLLWEESALHNELAREVDLYLPE